MILTTHAITGAGLATIMPNHPILAFSVGFLSHFVLDSIPHRDYTLINLENEKKSPIDENFRINKEYIKDLLKVTLDGVCGLLSTFILFVLLGKFSLFILLCGAIGGMMPDALQFVYLKWRHEPIISLQKFHVWIHSRVDMCERPILGTLSQLTVICFVLFISFNS